MIFQRISEYNSISNIKNYIFNILSPFIFFNYFIIIFNFIFFQEKIELKIKNNNNIITISFFKETYENNLYIKN